MDYVKKCKRVWGSNNRLFPEESGSGSYGKLPKESHKKQKDSTKKPPHGCLCVYVGPERQRFVIKIKIFNHPLFKTLLEDVENEYGYRNDGPLWLPCDVDLFCEALVEIESAEDHDLGFVGCNFPIVHKHNPFLILHCLVAPLT
ncbi:putative small auxin-up RNA [Medicago truncatula]|uniref:Putative small auxin-up RNA n=1 Tax=Medicago truncatula TaxID=3880 RepID=A0A072U572_MEDTR|nr:auxin-responsive protein SAUR32 [Medicago truncatula]KEH20995.1 SAUR-like auxin-responsive family protein [Medicago truncatula]RHN43281.1 putative small auxin-up RNA [Medicago truncatula]